MKYGSGVRVLFLATMVGGGISAAAQNGAVVTGDPAAPNYAQSSDGVQGNVGGQSSEAVNESQLAADQSAVNANGGMKPGDSHVRIVRLSDVSGTVGMDRLTGQGIETAIRNMPIVEGAKLGTGPNGLAEVEFEDQSTMGLAPKSLVVFSQLVRHGAGGTVSTIKLERGTMYVNLQGTKGNEFVVQVAGENVTVAPGTKLRLATPDVEKGGAEAEAGVASSATLAVFSGSAVVQGATGGEITVSKKESLALGDAGTAQVAKNVEKGPYDSWNKEEDEYQQRYSKANSLVGSGYGVSDLNYYGSFASLPGCGMVWQPYFVDASWSPYGTGLWAMYPGAGYSWVSPYPWGWLPYHSGEWAQCGGAGWGWRPGNTFYGLQNVAGVGGGGVGTGSLAGNSLNNRPVHFPLPTPPRAGQGSLVVASHGPIVSSRMEGDGFVFEKNSAGLGVPRGQLGNLNGVSREVIHNGAMSMPVDVRSMAHGPHGNAEAHGPMAMRPAGSPEVHNNAMNNAANNTGYRHGNEGNGGNGGNANANGGSRGSGGQNNSGGAQQHSGGQNNSGGGAPQHSGGGGNPGGGGFGGGGGNHGGGGGAPPSAPSSAPAASSGGAHK